jgi:hypothetical protein
MVKPKAKDITASLFSRCPEVKHLEYAINQVADLPCYNRAMRGIWKIAVSLFPSAPR